MELGTPFFSNKKNKPNLIYIVIISMSNKYVNTNQKINYKNFCWQMFVNVEYLGIYEDEIFKNHKEIDDFFNKK